MNIGMSVLAKHERKVKEFKVIQMFDEDLTLFDGTVTITVKYWEIRSVPNDWKQA
jgi:hypothetical protein